MLGETPHTEGAMQAMYQTSSFCQAGAFVRDGDGCEGGQFFGFLGILTNSGNDSLGFMMLFRKLG